MRWSSLTAVLAMLAGSVPALAQDSARLFFFGDDSLHRNDAPADTSVMVWLARLADAAGHDLAADGQTGDIAGFARNLPPEPDWRAEGVTPVWDAEALAFRRAGFDTLLIAGPEGLTSNLTTRLVDWAANQAPGARFLLWQAPGAGGDAVGWADAVAAARPGDAVSLVAAGPVLATALTTAMAGIDAGALGPEGLALAQAWVLHGALWAEPPPLLDSAILPEALRNRQAEVIAAIWQGLTGAVVPAGPAASAGDMGLADPALAMGLAGIADWSAQMPFIDVMKSARPWTGHTATQWGAWDAARLQAEGYLDAEGWLIALPPDLDRVEALMLTDMPPGAQSLAGRYRVTWAGTGTVGVAGLVRDVQATPGEIWFSYLPGPGTVAVAISATDPADPVRDIAVVRQDLIALYEAGAIFTPDWLTVVRDLRVVRFMDWMATNHSAQVTWADRPAPGDYTYGWRGVPVEVMIRLANEIGADPWFTLPHMADDAYVAAFATLVRDHLDPRLQVHAEWSNEVWNFIFGQAQWALARAEARWGAGTGDGWMQIAGERAAQVADIWAGVFDDPDRLVRVLGVHSGWQGLEVPLMEAPLAVAEGATPPVQSFDAIAVTGYFGYDVGSEDFAPTLRDWIAAGDAADRLTERLAAQDVPRIGADVFGYFGRVADDRGLRLLMYEGGTHITGQGALVEDAALTGFLTGYSYGPGMAALYAQLLADWAAHGDGPFNAFVDVAAPSKWGSWGALRHLDDLNPRAATLAAHNAQPPFWDDGTRAPGTFLQGGIRQGGTGSDRLEGTAEEDVSLGAEGDDLLLAGPGDRLHGGPGRDIALVPGLVSDWTITPEDGGRLRLDGAAGPIWLFAVEGLAGTDAPDAVTEVTQ